MLTESRIPLLHVAADPENGVQCCARCGMVLCSRGALWYAGQLVAEHDQARAAIRYAPLGWPECR